MFCSNCGAELYDPNQRYCHNCGNGIRITSRAPKPRVETTQYVYKSRTEPLREYADKELPPFEVGGIGKHSKKCLGYGITSLGIVIIGFWAASGIFIYPFAYLLLYVFNFNGLAAFIVFTIVNLIGLSFGFLSRANKVSAERIDSDNGVLKAGSIVGSIGFILNFIALCLDFIVPLIIYGVFVPVSYY